MASMRGEMSQMVAERPNADAVRHYDRCSVISRPRVRCFVPVVAHVITPIGVAAGPQKCPALSTFACSFGWFGYGLFALVTRNGRQHLGAFRVPRSAFRGALATLLRPSTSHSANCEQFRPLSEMRPSGAFCARRCHALARCCASLAFAWNRCASLRTPSSARH